MAGPIRSKGGGNIDVDDALSLTSENPVQNKILAAIHLDPAVYLPPSATLNNVSQDVENGTTLAQINLQVDFTQRDAGAATAYQILKNGTVIANAASTSLSNEVIPLGNIMFRGLVDFAQGAVKQNNFGEDDPAGQIQAGQILTNVRTISGTQRSFFGSVASSPLNSAEARSLTKIKSSSNSFSFYADQKNNAVIVPQGKNLSSVVSSNNETLTPQFTSQAITVNDAAGTPQNYTIYNLETAQPLEATLNVTLSN